MSDEEFRAIIAAGMGGHPRRPGGEAMSEPAKDEAELMDAMVDAIWEYLTPETRWTAKPYVERDLRAAIRAAGWAVVPVEPTEEMFDAGHASSAHGHGIVALYRAMLAAAPGVKP
jgi:hypothetical protein